MPDVFYNAQAVGVNDGSSWADAFTTLKAAAAVTGQSDTIWGDYTSSEEIDANIFIDFAGQRLISVTPTVNPPIDADYMPGLFIGDTDSVHDLFLRGSEFNSIGVDWQSGDDFDIQADRIVIEDGSITVDGGFDRIFLRVGTRLDLVNSDISLLNALSFIDAFEGDFSMRGGKILGIPNNLVIRGGEGGMFLFDGVDISTVTSSIVRFDTAIAQCIFIFKGCKLPAGVPLFSGAINIPSKVLAYGSSDANKPYFIQEETYYGTVITETTNIKSDGASDGITPISLKFISNDKVFEFVRPLRNELPILFYADTVGINTFEIDLLTDGVTLKDNEAWVDFTLPGADVQRVLAITRSKDAVDIPASPAAWDTTGIAVPVKQRITAQVDVQQKGWVEAYINIAKPSIDVYADVKLLDGQRQYLAGQAYINGEAVPQPEPPQPVINDYIMPMVAELVRDQIALIILTELPAQEAIAIDLAATQPETLAGKQAQLDIDNKIYDIINNIFTEKGTHFQNDQMPGLNIYFGRSDYSATEGDNVNTQVSNSNFTLEVHLQYKHKQAGVEPIEYGDEKSARVVARILGLLRGILMSGQYITLGDEFSGIVEKRRVTSLDVFQPDSQEDDAKQGLVGILNLDVKFRETGPQLMGETLTAARTSITIKLRTADDGKVIIIDT